MTPFEQGFIKAAMAEGLNHYHAIELLKQASGIGAYFASGPASRSYELNSPNAAAIGDLIGGGSITGEALTEMALGRLGGRKSEDRSKTISENTDKLDSEGYGANAHRYGKTYAGPSALIGGVGGALSGAALGGGLGGPGMFDGGVGGALSGAALGGGLGTLGGGALGYMGGGLQGLYDKFVTNHTNDDSKRRAHDFKSKHPYATALPFGDVIGAAMSKGKKQKD